MRRWTGSALYRVDLNTKATTTLVETELGVAQPDLAADGHTVVFLSATNWEGKNADLKVQVWQYDLSSGTLGQLTSEARDVKEVSLAGDGSTAFAVTEDLRVIRLDVASRQISVLAPAFPRVLAADPESSALRLNSYAQGGRYWIWGTGLADAEIFVGDTALQMKSRYENDADFLVPADALERMSAVRVGAAGSPVTPLNWLYAEQVIRSYETTPMEVVGVRPLAEEGYFAVTVRMPAAPGRGTYVGVWAGAPGATRYAVSRPAVAGK